MLNRTLSARNVELPSGKYPINTILPSADFFQNQFFEKLNSIRVSNNLDPDQARHFVQAPHFAGPDLGPKCLQRVTCADPERGIGLRPPPPLENHKLNGFP